MQWLFLMAAGLFEIGWAISLKMTNGWTNLSFLALNVVLGLGAAFCLSQSLRSIPLATAYPIWKGIAILGLVFWETYMEKQPFSMSRTVFAGLIIAGIVGLKLTAAAVQQPEDSDLKGASSAPSYPRQAAQ